REEGALLTKRTLLAMGGGGTSRVLRRKSPPLASGCPARRARPCSPVATAAAIALLGRRPVALRPHPRPPARPSRARPSHSRRARGRSRVTTDHPGAPRR